MSPAQITRRQNAVEELFENPHAAWTSSPEQLTGIYDLERIMTRIVYGSANGRELRSLSAALERLPGLLQRCWRAARPRCSSSLRQEMDGLEDVAQLIDARHCGRPALHHPGGRHHPGRATTQELDEAQAGHERRHGSSSPR